MSGFGSHRGQYRSDQNGKSWIERLVEHNREFYETCITGEVFKRSDAMTDNCLEQTLIRKVVTLHSECNDIAAKVVKYHAPGTTTVYEVDGRYYELLIRTGPGPLDLPVIVRPARVVRNAETPCTSTP